MRHPKKNGRIHWTTAIAKSCSELPIQPVVAAKIEGIQVSALIDTGSMKSFISSHMHAILDFFGGKIGRKELQLPLVHGIADNTQLCLSFHLFSIARVTWLVYKKPMFNNPISYH